VVGACVWLTAPLGASKRWGGETLGCWGFGSELKVVLDSFLVAWWEGRVGGFDVECGGVGEFGSVCWRVLLEGFKFVGQCGRNV